MKRKIEDKIFITLSWIAAGLCIMALALIIGTIALESLPSISTEFLIMSEFGNESTGIANAIIGTFLIAITSTMITLPIGMGTAIYVKKYAKNGPFLRLINFLINMLAGIPSIIIGLFGLFIFVFYLGPITGGFSMISGVLALFFVVLPVVEQSIEESIDTVPKELEHGSYALGATKWQTLKNIILPIASPGILTGAILGMGSAIGQSAVVLLTAGYNQFFPEFGIYPPDRGVVIFDMQVRPLQQPMATLPITIFNTFINPLVHPRSAAFATAFVLIVLLVLLNSTVRFITWRKNKI